MKKLMFVVVSLGLAFGSTACKKEEKKDGAKVEGDSKAVDKGATGDTAKPDPGTGSAAASKDPAPTDQAPAADGLKMAWKAPAVGEKSETTDELLTKMTITVKPGESVDLVQTRTKQVHLEVVEVNAEGVPTKLKAHYAKFEESQAMGGKADTKPSPIVGKAYVVWVEGDAIKATTGDGKEVSPEELAALTDDHKKDLGKVPGMAQVLLAKTWKVGEKVTLTPEELKTLASGDDEKLVPASATVWLASNDAGIATFELDIVGVMEDAQGKMEAPMKMVVKLDVAKVRPVEMTMSGTLGGKVKGMDTKGTMEGKKTFTYQ